MLVQCGGTINCPIEIVDTDLCGDRKVFIASVNLMPHDSAKDSPCISVIFYADTAQ